MTFDPNEQRDQLGRWTAGGSAAVAVQSDSPNAENARRYALAATRVAQDLGYDPSRITISDEDKQFELNGKTYNYAGAAYIHPSPGHEVGDIVLYEKHLAPGSIGNVTAHEIGHQKFQRFVNDYQAEYKQMTEATKDLDVDTFMKPDGMLKGEWADKFPLYQKYTEVMMPSILENFAKSDGITDYSERWWKAWHDQKANTSQAMHETLAEMTAREYELGPDIDVENVRFKNAGFALDYSSSGGKGSYSVRKWKGTKPLDPSALPPELQTRLGQLQAAQARTGNPRVFLKKPAPEWIALYNAINDHWTRT